MTKRPSVERANARLRQIVGSMHALVDVEHDKPEKQHPDVQCRDGCEHAATGCCSLITIVHRAEAEYIVARNREQVARLLPALLEADERIAARISTEDIASMFGDADTERRFATVYHELGLTCPFLDADRRCTIYRDRPLACRTHFVLSPPELCSTVGVEHEHVTLDKGTRTASQAMLVQAIMKERGPNIAMEFGTLPQLVLLAVATQR